MSHCLWEMCWAPIWYFTSDKLAHRVHGSSGVFGTESLSLPCTPNRQIPGPGSLLPTEQQVCTVVHRATLLERLANPCGESN